MAQQALFQGRARVRGKKASAAERKKDRGRQRAARGETTGERAAARKRTAVRGCGGVSRGSARSYRRARRACLFDQAK